MKMKPKMLYTIVGIHLPNRFKLATDVQKVLTEYGCSIRTRVGLHDVDENCCATNGLVLLEMYGEKAKINKMLDQLSTIDRSIDVQQMIFQLNPKKALFQENS
jgi:hypothetical protein